MSRLLPLMMVSLIWFGIGWFLHDLVQPKSSLNQLPAEQQRTIKAQQILQSRQLLLDVTLPQTAVPEAFTEAAIGGMLVWSQDPHANLYGPLATARYRQIREETQAITDIWFDLIDGQFVVTELPPNSPALAAGLMVGDVLLSVDGVVFDQFMRPPEVSLLLQGPMNSTAEITFRRGEEIYTVSVTRQQRPYLTHQIIDEQIGYLRTEFFSLEKTLALFTEAIDEFTASNVQAIIWDLRDNRGGYPSGAEKILGYFIKPGMLLYTVEFKDGTKKEFRAEGDGRFADLPIVMLINHETWSTGEIVAAAMAERSIHIFGTSTAGKGIIQDTVPLDENHLLHFTVAKWLTPQGEWLHKKGMPPDVRIEDDPNTAEDEVLTTALSFLSELLADNREAASAE